MPPRLVLLLSAAFLGACSPPRATPALTVAAAANLTGVLAEAGPAFRAKTGIEVVFSYGPTAELAQQIDHGGPFDLFAAADTGHVDALIASGKLARESRAVYALGQLALWVPPGGPGAIEKPDDLARPQVRFIAVAQPALAPYGQASVEALQALRIWNEVQPKIVYSNSVSQAKQLAASGNADAAFTAYSLVLHDSGRVLRIDPRLYAPIEQALAVASASPHAQNAGRFRAFLLGPEGRKILEKNGYLLPPH